MEALDAGYSDNMDLYSEQEQIKKDALGVAYAGVLSLLLALLVVNKISRWF